MVKWIRSASSVGGNTINIVPVRCLEINRTAAKLSGSGQLHLLGVTSEV